jgi:CheY-like chemotaxis protein
MTLGAPKANILIVDDEPIVVEVVGRYLRRDGFAVTSASTGDEGLQAGLDKQNPPQVIVLDVMLPGIDGFEVSAPAAVRCRPHHPARRVRGEIVSAVWALAPTTT